MHFCGKHIVARNKTAGRDFDGSVQRARFVASSERVIIEDHSRTDPKAAKLGAIQIEDSAIVHHVRQEQPDPGCISPREIEMAANIQSRVMNAGLVEIATLT